MVSFMHRRQKRQVFIGALLLFAFAFTALAPVPVLSADVSTSPTVSKTWDFTNPDDYQYDRRKVEIKGGKCGFGVFVDSDTVTGGGATVAVDTTESGLVYAAGNKSTPGATPEKDKNEVVLNRSDWRLKNISGVLVKEGPGYECGASEIACDSEGSVLVAGQERTKNNTPPTGWLRKYSGNLGFIWAKTFSKQSPVSVASDRYGNSVVGTVPYRAYTANIIKYDKGGGTVWSATVADGSFDYQLKDVALDWNGDVIVAGSYCARGKGQRWQWVRKLKGSDGSALWEFKQAAKGSQATATAVVADLWGNVVVAGENCLKLGCSDGALIWNRHPVEHAMCYDVDVDMDNTYYFATDLPQKNKKTGKTYYRIAVCKMLPSGQIIQAANVSKNTYNSRFASIACYNRCRVACGYWCDRAVGSTAGLTTAVIETWDRSIKTTKCLTTNGMKPTSFTTAEAPENSVCYQLSPDGKTWYDFDPVAARWVEAKETRPDAAYYAYAGYSRYPSAEAVNAGISAFRGIAGEGLYVKAILMQGDELAGTSASLSSITATAKEAPAGASEYYFAEGTTRPGFDTYFCIQNPGEQAAAVTLLFLRGTGEVVRRDVSVPPHSRSTLNASDSVGRGDDESHDFSTYVECTNGQGIFVERPMYFDYKGWTGGHTAVGALDSSDRFYFAEGTCRPGFDPYFCIMNPEEKDADVRITYFKGDGSAATKEMSVPAHTRRTVAPKDTLGVGDDAAHDFSTKVEVTNAGAYVVAERPMYFNYNGWTGGHDVMGERSSSGISYFAEGTCRPGFDSYICLMNPNGAVVDAKITFMKGDGKTAEHRVSVPGFTRSTVSVKDVLGVADDAAHDFSARVDADGVGHLVCERPMYFNYKPGERNWDGGHNVVGTPTPASSFYFAEGTCRPGFDPYLCVQNPRQTPAEVKITYMLGDGTTKEQNLEIPPQTRVTVNPRDLIGSADSVACDFSTVVETTNNTQVICERPIYFNYQGKWTGGHNAPGALP